MKTFCSLAPLKNYKIVPKIVVKLHFLGFTPPYLFIGMSYFSKLFVSPFVFLSMPFGHLERVLIQRTKAYSSNST